MRPGQGHSDRERHFALPVGLVCFAGLTFSSPVRKTPTAITFQKFALSSVAAVELRDTQKRLKMLRGKKHDLPILKTRLSSLVCSRGPLQTFHRQLSSE